MTAKWCVQCKSYREPHDHDPSLFDAAGQVEELVTAPGQARADDPKTSHQAAAKVKAGSARHWLIWSYAASGTELTSYEANLRVDGKGGMEYSTRCSELKRSGYLEPTGESRVSQESGMKREVLRITPAGRAMAAALGEPA